jgi:hypothetical protein
MDKKGYFVCKPLALVVTREKKNFKNAGDFSDVATVFGNVFSKNSLPYHCHNKR